MKHKIWTAFIVPLTLATLATGIAAAEPLRVGKNPGEQKGRWLEIQDPQAFEGYSTVYFGEVRTDLQYEDRQKAAIDGEIINSSIRKRFFKRLIKSKLFGVVLGNPPAGEEPNALRFDFDLVVDPGDRAARAVIGLGAGKSKSILEIHMEDHETGETIGKYHGYGSGAGIGLKIGGGSAKKMTLDDVEEHSDKLIELLKKVR